MTTMTQIAVAAGADDAVSAGTTRDGVGSGYDQTGSIAYIGADWSVFRTVGLRFQNVTIPKGATINSASITIYSAAAQTNACSFTLYGQLHANAPAFPASDSSNTTSGSPGYRTRTNHGTVWNAASGLTDWESLLPYTSPDLSAELQEMVNLPDYAAGNSVVWLLLNTGSSLGDLRRSICMYEIGYPARFDATYTVAGGIPVTQQHLLTQGIR